MIPTMYIVYGVAALGVLLSAALYKVWLRLFGVVIVPKDAIGIVNKKFVLFGKNKQLPPGSVLALNGVVASNSSRMLLSGAGRMAAGW